MNCMALMSLRAKIEGFIAMDCVHEFKEAKQNMVGWISEGKLMFKEDVREGLDEAPECLNELFSRGNPGSCLPELETQLWSNCHVIPGFDAVHCELQMSVAMLQQLFHTTEQDNCQASH